MKHSIPVGPVNGIFSGFSTVEAFCLQNYMFREGTWSYDYNKYSVVIGEQLMQDGVPCKA